MVGAGSFAGPASRFGSGIVSVWATGPSQVQLASLWLGCESESPTAGDSCGHVERRPFGGCANLVAWASVAPIGPGEVCA